jgi:hypothetical protein
MIEMFSIERNLFVGSGRDNRILLQCTQEAFFGVASIKRAPFLATCGLAGEASKPPSYFFTNRDSVPFIRRTIFARCRQTAKAQIKIEKINKIQNSVPALGKTRKTDNGREIAPAIEARDTYLLA